MFSFLLPQTPKNIERDLRYFKRCVRIIQSCDTLDQFKTSVQLIRNYHKLTGNQVFSDTLRNNLEQIVIRKGTGMKNIFQWKSKKGLI